jgi:hypothetical protein
MTRKKARARSRNKILLAIVLGLVIAVSATAIYYYTSHTVSTETSDQVKPIILYVNQGNGVVNSSNFGTLVAFSTSHGFNTIFFQIYRSGVLLFTSADLTSFVTTAHDAKLKIFFALYFTSDSQTIPTSIYSLGEDGINLDMSALSPSTQSALLSTLSLNYHGLSAVTSTNFDTTLKPDWLILETYGSTYDQYIHAGIIASVGVFTTSSQAQYFQEFQYALDNSNGVMVFDYATLSSRGY